MMDDPMNPQAVPQGAPAEPVQAPEVKPQDAPVEAPANPIPPPAEMPPQSN